VKCAFVFVKLMLIRCVAILNKFIKWSDQYQRMIRFLCIYTN